MIARSLPRPRARLLLTVVVVLAIIVATWLLMKGISDSLSPPRINITRSEYDQALAKWQAQKIEEYEITTETRAFMGGTLTLHVSDYGNKVEQLAPKVRLASDLTAQDIEFLKRDTVEGLFAQVDDILADSNVFKTAAMYVSGDFYMAYEVSFHPDLGYPQYMSGRPITKPGAHVYDADWITTLTSLKVIKQGK